jgi:hypothetical protein
MFYLGTMQLMYSLEIGPHLMCYSYSSAMDLLIAVQVYPDNMLCVFIIILSVPNAFWIGSWIWTFYSSMNIVFYIVQAKCECHFIMPRQLILIVKSVSLLYVSCMSLSANIYNAWQHNLILI